MKQPRANHRAHYGAGIRGTIQQLIVPSHRSHNANFKAILPSAMAKLVEDGLFVRNGVDEIGNPAYKITKKGLAKLKELENGH